MARKKSSAPVFIVGLIGLLTGGAIGFIMRPADALGRQLPFDAVITRGESLKGIGAALLTRLAQTSFNYLLAGAVIGLAAGAVVGYLISRR